MSATIKPEMLDQFFFFWRLFNLKMHLIYVERYLAEKEQFFVLKRKNERNIEEFLVIDALRSTALSIEASYTAIVRWILINLFLITFLTKFCYFSPNILDKWSKVYEGKSYTLVTLYNSWFPVSDLPFHVLLWYWADSLHRPLPQRYALHFSQPSAYHFRLA